MVAGDHHRPDPGAAAARHRLAHLRPGRIQLGHQAEQHLMVEVPVVDGVVGGAGEGQHPQPGAGQIEGPLQPPLPLGFAEHAPGPGHRASDRSRASTTSGAPLLSIRVAEPAAPAPRGAPRTASGSSTQTAMIWCSELKGISARRAETAAQLRRVEMGLGGHHHQGALGGIPQHLPGPISGCAASGRRCTAPPPAAADPGHRAPARPWRRSGGGRSAAENAPLGAIALARSP